MPRDADAGAPRRVCGLRPALPARPQNAAGNTLAGRQIFGTSAWCAGDMFNFHKCILAKLIETQASSRRNPGSVAALKFIWA